MAEIEDGDAHVGESGRRYAVPVVPAPVLGSPSLPRGIDPDEEMWWTPDWTDRLRVVGWWWLALGPAVLLSAAVLVLVFLAGFRGVAIWPGSIKVLLFCGAVGATVVVYAIKRIVRMRTEPFCIHCGYALTGLPAEGKCPECGRMYEPATIAEYRKDPRFFRERYRAQRRQPPGNVLLDAGMTRDSRNRPDGT